jgi:hypothetical protein
MHPRYRYPTTIPSYILCHVWYHPPTILVSYHHHRHKWPWHSHHYDYRYERQHSHQQRHHRPPPSLQNTSTDNTSPPSALPPCPYHTTTYTLPPPPISPLQCLPRVRLCLKLFVCVRYIFLPLQERHRVADKTGMMGGAATASEEKTEWTFSENGRPVSLRSTHGDMHYPDSTRL